MPIAMQSIFSILSGVSMFFLPDTPRWYYVRGRTEEGDKTLARLYGIYRTGTIDYTGMPEVQEMKSTIMASFRVEEEAENKLTWLSLVWDNTPLRVGRRVRISFIILGIQQSMGINILVYYMTRIFSEVGLSDFMASLIAALSLTVQWLGSIVCVPTIERIGRRRIMIFTASIETCCMLIFVVLNMIENKTDATRWTAAMIMFPYLFFYGWGWVGCPWLYGPEACHVRVILEYELTLDADCTPEIPPHWLRSGTARCMGIHIYHCLRWWNCVEDCWGQDLDMASGFQCHRSNICLLYVS